MTEPFAFCRPQGCFVLEEMFKKLCKLSSINCYKASLSSSKLDSIPYYNPGTARSEVQLGKRLFCEQMMQKLNLPGTAIKMETF